MAKTITKTALPKYKWVLRETDPSLAYQQAQTLAAELDCSPLLARVLLARGIDTPDRASDYLNPNETQILPPDAIPGLLQARDRILKAISDSEPVMVHGDYDADGVIGAVILHMTLRDLECPSRIFLPKRDFHGFGLAHQAVEKAKEAGIKLIVTVDCGISSAEAVKAARDAGIEVIVTDHHAIPEVLPADAILVHPELSGDYPGGKIAGATVGFKLALAVIESLGRDADEYKSKLLPLVAVATVADVCPLTKENRALTALGIEKIASSEIPGLRALFEGTRRDGNTDPVSARDIAFGMAPCINAAGRMGDPFPAAKLLLAKDMDTAWTHFRTLDRMNRERKRIQAEICRRLGELPEVAWAAPDAGVLALVDRDCIPGLAGLAAMRLAEQTGRPTLILSPTEDESGPLYRGSMRSSGSDNLIQLMEPTREHAEGLGGHTGAIGMTVRPEKLNDFLEACREIEWTPTPSELALDFETEEAPRGPDDVTDLDATRPWGVGNPPPAFIWGPVKIEKTRAVGKDLQHMQVTFRAGDGSTVKGIAFSMAGHIDDSNPLGRSVKVAGQFILNNWQGKTSVEFQLSDMEII